MGDDGVRIKFCGVTRHEDAERAVELGAWALGLNFWPKSVRRCDPVEAAAISRALRRRVEVCGIFVNASLDRIATVADTVGLTMLQLHGDEGPAFCSEAARRTGCRVVKAIRVRTAGDVRALHAFATSFHLLDAYAAGRPGGTGTTFPWALARGRAADVPRILSGGLTPENVGEAVAVARPYAVDVASGVESAPGVKDPERLAAFADAVAAATAAPA